MPLDLVPPSHLGSVWSALCVYGFGGLLVGAPLAWMILRFARHALAAARAAADEAKPPRLEPGHALLRGTVETDDDRPVLALTVSEVGEERKSRKGSSGHTWEERSRKLEARPFTLRLPGGEAVHVELDESVRLMDALSLEYLTSDMRERRAKIVAGDQVCVEGELVRAQRGGGVYRGDDAGLVLRRSQTKPMRMASGTLSAAHRRARSWYAKAALALAAVFFVLHLGLFSSYHQLVFAGQVTAARVTGQSTYTSRGKGGTMTHHMLEVEIEPPGAAPFILSSAVDRSIHERAERGELREVQARVVPGRPDIHHLGAAPALHEVNALFGFILGVIALVMFSSRYKQAPWYDQRCLGSSGSGTLLENMQRHLQSQERAGGAAASAPDAPDAGNSASTGKKRRRRGAPRPHPDRDG